MASIRAQRVVDVDRVDRHVADIRAGAEIVGRDKRSVIHEPHQGGCLADLARAKARAGPVRGRAVERDAEQRDVDLARRLRRAAICGSRMKVEMPAKRGTTMPESGW